MKKGNKNSRCKISITLDENSETKSNYESDCSFEPLIHNRNKLTKSKKIISPKNNENVKHQFISKSSSKALTFYGIDYEEVDDNFLEIFNMFH